MPKDITEITTEPGTLRAEYSTIHTSPHRRFYIYFGVLFVWIVIGCIFFFAPGKQSRESLFDDMHNSSIHSIEFFVPLLFGAGFLLPAGWMLTRTIRVLYPGAQKLECNSIALTFSQLRWFDWDNQSWMSDSWPLTDISRVRYGVIVSGRGNSTYGLRFRAAGKNYKIFPHLSTVQAGKLLAQLESLGVVTERQRKAAAKQAKRLARR